METENNIKFKYIVYQTTNVVNNKIYIGVHKTINPNIFDGYLGCGVKINDTSTYEHAKTAFQYAVKKYGPKNFKRQTLAIFDTEIEAYKLEELLVTEEFLSRNDVYNMVLGGFSGMYSSEKIKIHLYDKRGHFITTFTSQTDAAKYLKTSTGCIGRSCLLGFKVNDYYCC